jgi:hypothetical protein
MDGRVLLFSDDGEPFQVKNDMGVAGALLLRWVGAGVLGVACAVGARAAEVAGVVCTACSMVHLLCLCGVFV